jgi:hypothetical protein
VPGGEDDDEFYYSDDNISSPNMGRVPQAATSAIPFSKLQKGGNTNAINIGSNAGSPDTYDNNYGFVSSYQSSGSAVAPQLQLHDVSEQPTPLAQQNGYQAITDSYALPVQGVEEDDDDVKAPRPRVLHLYESTWSEWLTRIIEAETCNDCWRAIKSRGIFESETGIAGHRQFTQHPGSTGAGEDEERVALISPPEHRKRFLSKAFVTFKTFTGATIARQVVHMQLAGHMAISEAPAPTDITWMNMYATRTGLFWRRVFVETMVVLLTIVWVAPVTLLSYVVSSDALRSFFPWLDEWCDRSQWMTSIVSLAQPGALMAIMNLLPPILSGLAVLEGCISYSANQFKSFDRYFTFQVINVFLVTTVAGSVLDSIKQIYLNPASTYLLLGTSIPKMGAYFLNYMIIKAFVGLGMEIMRFPSAFSAFLKYLSSSNLTLRDRKLTPLFGGLRHLLNPGSFAFAKIYAQDCLQVVICFTFACIAPLTTFGGMLYFAIASYIYKHQVLYVYEPAFETGGKWFLKMAQSFVIAILFAQLTLVGILVLKEVYLQAYILGGLVVITSFYYYHVNAIYVPLAAQLPFDMAASMDLDSNKYDDELAGAELYIQPSLRASPMVPECEFQVGDYLKSDLGVKRESAVV